MSRVSGILWVGSLVLLLAGCASPAPRTLAGAMAEFPEEGFITQRGLLTVRGRQFPLNGYLAHSATGGRRLVVTGQFGNVLADVLVTPSGTVHVLRSGDAFRPAWIRDYVAADLECLFGGAPEPGCPGEQLGPGRFRIERRWYQLELTTVESRAGPQPASLFQAVPPES